MSRIRKFDLDRVKAELDWLAERDVDAILLTDANFGILARDVEIAAYIAELRSKLGSPRSVILTFAKNTVKHTLEITKILLDAGLATEATLGFQTTDEATLLNVRRNNIKRETYEQLAMEARKRRLPVLADLMLGLPGMTKATFKADLQVCCEQEVSARVFPTLALENSPLNSTEYREQHLIQVDEFQQVIASSSFTAAEREEIVLLRNAFRFVDHFGALRHVLRFVAHETGQDQIEVFDGIYERVTSEPSAFPALTFAFRHSRRYLTPSFGWPVLLAEARMLVRHHHGLDPEGGLDAVLKAQDAVLPTPGRSYPYRIELEFDVTAYVEQFLLPEEPRPPRRLCTFPSGSLVVEDPSGIAGGGGASARAAHPRFHGVDGSAQ